MEEQIRPDALFAALLLFYMCRYTSFQDPSTRVSIQPVHWEAFVHFVSFLSVRSRNVLPELQLR